jgi:DNA-directed RNA polymerase specialized sigma subunit
MNAEIVMGENSNISSKIISNEREENVTLSNENIVDKKNITGCKTDAKRRGKRVRAISTAEKKRIVTMLELWGETNKGLRAKREELEAVRRARENVGFTTGMLAVAEQLLTVPAFEKHIQILLEEINTCMENKRQMDSIIDTLPIMTQAVLRARYVKQLRWDLITVYLPFQISERHCFRLHNQALLHIRDSLRKVETKNEAK